MPPVCLSSTVPPSSGISQENSPVSVHTSKTNHLIHVSSVYVLRAWGLIHSPNSLRFGWSESSLTTPSCISMYLWNGWSESTGMFLLAHLILPSSTYTLMLAPSSFGKM